MAQNVYSLDLPPALGHLESLVDIAPDDLPALMDIWSALRMIKLSLGYGAQ